MFDPGLTIETGIERVGEILDGRVIEVNPGDPVFEQIREFRRCLGILFDNDAVIDLGLIGHVLTNRRFKKEYDTVFSENSFIPGDWFKRQPRTRYSSGGDGITIEAVMNALEYGGERVSIRHLVGRKGEFYVIAQENQGPTLEAIYERFSQGETFNYKKGEYLRGNGFQSYSQSLSSVWYMVNDTEYALLLSIPAQGELYDTEAPLSQLPWRPEPDTLDALLWNELVDCSAGTSDPRIYFREFFAHHRLDLEDVLRQVDSRVRHLFEVNVQGFLELEIED